MNAAPSIVVYHKKEFGLGYFLSQRYHYSRSYAGMRTQGVPIQKKLIRAALCSILPPILTLRIAGWVVGKKQHVSMLFRCLPLILCSLPLSGRGANSSAICLVRGTAC